MLSPVTGWATRVALNCMQTRFDRIAEDRCDDMPPCVRLRDLGHIRLDRSGLRLRIEQPVRRGETSHAQHHSRRRNGSGLGVRPGWTIPQPSVASTDSRPIAAPLPPASAPKLAEVPSAAPVAPSPVAVAPPASPAPPAAAPETGAPPVTAAPTAPAAPAVAAPATVDAPKYVERPPVAPVAEPAKIDGTKSAKRAERRHRGHYWTAGRIIGELQRYGVYW